MISAHESPLAAMAFDMTGTKLATASNKVRRKSKIKRQRIVFFLRERSFEFIMFSMEVVCSNFVEEFDGKSKRFQEKENFSFGFFFLSALRRFIP